MKAAELLATLPVTHMRLGLERIEAALEALGRPQRDFPSLLVAGTNGKGSTCAMLEAVQRAAGRVTGLYTSPHLVSVRERIRLAGLPIVESALDEAVDELVRAYPPAALPGHPDGLSHFEVLTAAALLMFSRAQVEIAILEVGLGGRLDATNVPGTRLVGTAVTRLGLDHVEVLGPTLAAIAGEKAAIARPGVPLVSAPLVPATRAVLRARAEQVGAKLLEAGRELTLWPGDGGLEFHGGGRSVTGLKLGLRGPHQSENACVALGLLAPFGAALPVSDDAIRRGLAGARWPGRLEELPGAPRVVLDGAHNVDGARALVDAFVHLWPATRPVLVFGVLAEKDRHEMMEALLPLARSVHLCAPQSPRAVAAAVLAQEARGISEAPATAHATIEGALAAAMAEAGPAGLVLVAGSLYLVGAVRRLLVGDAPAC